MMYNPYMERALELAREAMLLGEVPVGAVIVDNSDGSVIGEGFNRRETDCDPLGHAELAAISAAAKSRGSWRLSGCTIYVTLEPCPMCAGAIINARLSRVVFGAFDEKAGSVESVTKLFSFPYNHKPEILSGIYEKQCADLLRGFFEGLRDGGNA